MNRGLTLIVIVIVIGSLLGATFFLKSGTLIFALFGITLIGQNTHFTHKTPPPCLRYAFALPPLLNWRQRGGKVYPKWKKTAPDITYPFVG